MRDTKLDVTAAGRILQKLLTTRQPFDVSLIGRMSFHPSCPLIDASFGWLIVSFHEKYGGDELALLDMPQKS